MMVARSFSYRDSTEILCISCITTAQPDIWDVKRLWSLSVVGLSDDIRCWCNTCNQCAMKKPEPGVGKAGMHHNEVHEPSECIAIDIVGPLPITNRRIQCIMVVGDWCISRTGKKPCNSRSYCTDSSWYPCY